MTKKELISKLVEAALVIFYEHSKLSPSAAKRWMTCAGSVRLIEQLFVIEITKLLNKQSVATLEKLLKDKKREGLKKLIDLLQENASKYAAEGTVAHQICEECLLNHKDPKEYLGLKMEADGFTFTVTQNMVEACEVYVDYIREQLVEAELQADITLDLEVEVKCSLKHLEIKGLDGGTSDAVITNKEHCTIEVVDYKHGSGVAVESENNPQAMQYALGALHLLESQGEDISDYQVYITIVQPRAMHKEGPIRTWKVSAIALRTWQDEDLIPAAKATHEPDAPLVPSDDGCRFCPVKDCSAKYQKVNEVAMLDFDNLEEEKATLPQPETMTVEQKIKVLDHINMIRSFLVAVEKQVKFEVDSGSEDYKGRYKLVESNTQRKLTDEAFDEICSPLLDYLEPEDLYEQKPKGIGALEASLKDYFRKEGVRGFTKKVKEILDQVTDKPKGELVIAPESDTRKEVQPTIISDFDDLQGSHCTNPLNQ